MSHPNSDKSDGGPMILSNLTECIFRIGGLDPCLYFGAALSKCVSQKCGPNWFPPC